jgi:bacillithiol biosynthesis deacetylase BshB1
VTDFDIAALCAHPDDAEAMLGGTLSLEAARGRRVAIVDLTAGESGSRGNRETRAREAAEAARILGVAHRECLGLPDAGLALVAEQKDRVVEALRRLRPRIVVLHHWDQLHPDHSTASRLGTDASYLSGLVNYRPDHGPPFRPARLVYALAQHHFDDACATFIVDISKHWDSKMRAVGAYASQFSPPPGTAPNPLDDAMTNMELVARSLGRRIGVAYGEGFVVREEVGVESLFWLAGGI